jgi:F-type H+-transporting ATPase subunit b
VLTAVVNVRGADVEVRFLAQEEGEEEGTEGEEAHADEAQDELNPIFPELKEIAWGFGSFVVLAVLMRFFLFPRLKRSMDARYKGIQDNHQQAEALTAGARADVADYDEQVAAAKAESHRLVEEARATLETERQARLAEANARIAERRAAALADVDAAKLAVRDQVEAAVADVASAASQIATGKAADPALVSRVVSDTVRAGAPS